MLKIRGQSLDGWEGQDARPLRKVSGSPTEPFLWQAWEKSSLKWQESVRGGEAEVSSCSEWCYFYYTFYWQKELMHFKSDEFNYFRSQQHDARLDAGVGVRLSDEKHRNGDEALWALVPPLGLWLLCDFQLGSSISGPSQFLYTIKEDFFHFIL